MYFYYQIPLYCFLGKASNLSNQLFYYIVPSPSTALEIACFGGDDVGKKSLKDKKVELNAMI